MLDNRPAEAEAAAAEAEGAARAAGLEADKENAISELQRHNGVVVG